jgi:hypothetical protein
VSAVSSAIASARRLVRGGKPFPVAIRAAADEYGVSTVDVSTGLRGPRQRKKNERELPDRYCHVPDNAHWMD